MDSSDQKNVCEESIFQGLFKTLAAQIRNFLIYKGSEVEQANDIVQDSFIKMWENCAKVSPEKAKSYLFTLASNSFKNEMAHLKVKLKYTESNKGANTTIETPEFTMLESEFKQKLDNALAEMVPTQREVFLLNRVEKMKYAEIADLLGVSVKAVEKRMGKALKFIRERIKEFK